MLYISEGPYCFNIEIKGINMSKWYEDLNDDKTLSIAKKYAYTLLLLLHDCVDDVFLTKVSIILHSDMDKPNNSLK